MSTWSDPINKSTLPNSIDSSRCEKRGFPHLMRVSEPWVFREAFQNGVRFPGKLITLYRIKSGKSGLRLGVAASKRLFGRSVDRSRAKRLMREAWRLNYHGFSGDYDIILSARHLIIEALRQDVEKDLLLLAVKAAILK